MTKNIWAIIPARAGSKGLENKNIKILNGIPLMAHAIKFAVKANIFSRVLLSTDSPEYAKIGEKYGAWVPFLRSEFASNDSSMEEDIHIDLNNKLSQLNIQKPDVIVWLRPTFPFRSIQDLKDGLKLLTKNVDSVRFVTPCESRIFKINDGLINRFDHLPNKSMIRRQDVPNGYCVYHTDIYWYKNIIWGEKFLGQKVVPHLIDKICQNDIDNSKDFEIVELLYKLNSPRLSNYIHTD